MEKLIEVAEDLKSKVEVFHEILETNSNPHFRGTQIFFSPLIKRPTFLFIGINPGAGYFNDRDQNVKRFSPLQNFEYLHYNYQLATETRKVMKLAGLTKELKTAMKINYFFFATKDESSLYKLLNSQKDKKVYYHSRVWVERLIEAIDPKIIICEGTSAFHRLTGVSAPTSNLPDGVYASILNGRDIVGYSRLRSFIRNKEGLSEVLKEKFGNLVDSHEGDLSK
ncbi:hypothetical protein ACTHQF_01110 [Pedobacter sp. SAFR-022]|uniref:hypothetical protein n=1 Tax=Pedobacter sp. SAFR-022 TaxID=3436861 RepID=UPI003F7EBFDC